jgi:hypothetical protein
MPEKKKIVNRKKPKEIDEAVKESQLLSDLLEEIDNVEEDNKQKIRLPETISGQVMSNSEWEEPNKLKRDADLLQEEDETANSELNLIDSVLEEIDEEYAQSKKSKIVAVPNISMSSPDKQEKRLSKYDVPKLDLIIGADNPEEAAAKSVSPMKHIAHTKEDTELMSNILEEYEKEN